MLVKIGRKKINNFYETRKFCLNNLTSRMKLIKKIETIRTDHNDHFNLTYLNFIPDMLLNYLQQNHQSTQHPDILTHVQPSEKSKPTTSRDHQLRIEPLPSWLRASMGLSCHFRGVSSQFVKCLVDILCCGLVCGLVQLVNFIQEIYIPFGLFW